MPTYIVGFDSKWQEKFDDEAQAIQWAREVADTGRTVEVIKRRFGFCKFITGFPESKQAELRARWKGPVGLFIGASATGIYGSPGGGGGDFGGGDGGGGGC